MSDQSTIVPDNGSNHSTTIPDKKDHTIMSNEQALDKTISIYSKYHSLYAYTAYKSKAAQIEAFRQFLEKPIREIDITFGIWKKYDGREALEPLIALFQCLIIDFPMYISEWYEVCCKGVHRTLVELYEQPPSVWENHNDKDEALKDWFRLWRDANRSGESILLKE